MKSLIFFIGVLAKYQFCFLALARISGLASSDEPGQIQQFCAWAVHDIVFPFSVFK
ncbi:MAG: hypothetical protein H3C41_04945 [Bacteroidales bacterium]|nr:hypothetical protein [Bacteroidales bacterium]